MTTGLIFLLCVAGIGLIGMFIFAIAVACHGSGYESGREAAAEQRTIDLEEFRSRCASAVEAVMKAHAEHGIEVTPNGMAAIIEGVPIDDEDECCE